MSASPSGGPGPNGQRPTPPPGAPSLRRLRKPVNPLVAPRRPVKRPVAPKPAPLDKGSLTDKRGGKSKQPEPPSKPGPTFDHLRRQNDGWSRPKPPGAVEYPLFITKKDLKGGLRFHIMRFAPSKGSTDDIDPTNQQKFTRPVTLHRRDPRQPPPGREVKEEAPEQPPANAEDEEKLAKQKAERDAQRALDDAQKAPVTKELALKRQQGKQKEQKPFVQVNYQARTEKQKKEQEIRYVEALPWHLEDADGKNVWVGQYEAPLSESKVALMIHNGGFRMVPLEKWYKFTPKRGAFNHMSIEEAEKAMSRKTAPARWAIRETDRKNAELAMEESRKIVNGRAAIKQESNTFQQSSRGDKMDHDTLDLSGDEFQDDDETAGFEPDRDEEVKDSKERVRREQLGANLFGDADENKVEKEEASVKKEEEERKVLGKSLKKALKKRDKQFQYDSDSDSNHDPFASSSSESDSDSEREREKEKEKEEDKKGDKGASSKGNNTPQGKKAAAEAAKKTKSLKRAGSPMVSDSSGAESTRKKKKLETGASMAGSRGNTPLPANQRIRSGAGSTSDGEATAGEMSDGAGGKKKKKRPVLGASARGTPSGSRAGSPVAPHGSNVVGSKPTTSSARAASPGSPAQGQSKEVIHPISSQEIIDAMPPHPQGISVGQLLKKFEHRLEKPGFPTRKSWLDQVKMCTAWDKTQKLLRRKA
ncbi:Uu.00g047190.m01.CDS01 [Anthostomella pinea]|uniref:Uu.00g047190.m01.CDS01 n=1 Tax=Anthostomella pinea TaxID=933095 RepID=A0AAI8VCH4_9PEZI|nr:Uu.00g047190.m01.CDS01 [Anthostomella pinea]